MKYCLAQFRTRIGIAQILIGLKAINDGELLALVLEQLDPKGDFIL